MTVKQLSKYSSPEDKGDYRVGFRRAVIVENVPYQELDRRSAISLAPQTATAATGGFSK